MENNNVNQVEETTLEQAIEETSGRRKVYKDQDFYPYCAIIMCVCAAIGHLIGTYILKDAQMGSGIGMGVGAVLAVIFIKKGGKQIDNSPIKERTKKTNNV